MEDGSSSTVATVGWSSSDDADAVLDSVHSVFVSWSVSSREQTDRDGPGRDGPVQREELAVPVPVLHPLAPAVERLPDVL
jgi:hypothetical protein